VVQIFTTRGERCLRLVLALAVETHEDWLESPCYVNMDDLRDYKKQQIRAAA
jgi:putative transposase